MIRSTQVIVLVILFLFSSASVFDVSAQMISSEPRILDPMIIPKWINQLDSHIPVYIPVNVTDSNGNVIRQDYTVSASQFYQQILPTVDSNGKPTGYGPSKVWGYGGQAMDAVTGKNLGFSRSVPGPTFEAIRGVPIQVKWVNDLIDSDGKPLQHIYPVDPTIHWANPNNIDMNAAMEQTIQGLAPPFPPGYNGSSYTLPGTATVTNPEGWNAQSPVPIVTHLHGGQVPSDYDGGPEQWFTPDGVHGKDYRTASSTSANAAVYYYPNTQEPTALWYHDHALGLTRLSVFSGLAGFYILHDPADTLTSLLPSGAYEVPLIIQDRTFLTDGSMYYPSVGYYPDYMPPEFNYTKENPYSLIAFVGNTNVVNGKVWPNMNVNRGQYRFRILDASNARFYNITFSNGMPFTLIGTDGGYLKSPVNVTSALFSPAERVDILVDFSKMMPGEKVVLKNAALWNTSSPKFPNQPETIGQIMQFTVTPDEGFKPQELPSQLNPTLSGDYPNLPTPTKTRVLTLGEDISVSPAFPMKLFLDGQEWAAPASETPEVGATEDWVLVNTFDSHNLHLHLAQFQLVSRQSFNLTAYWHDWTALNENPFPINHTTINVPSITPYLLGSPTLPGPNEQGWKDTIIVYSRQVTVIRVRFTQQDGSNYPFDPTTGPGYVWHCHILEHEDNQMMRPIILVSSHGPILQNIIIAIIALSIGSALAFVVYRKLRSHFNKRKRQ